MRAGCVACSRIPKLGIAALGSTTTSMQATCQETQELRCATTQMAPAVIFPLPPPLRGSYIDRKPTAASFNEHHATASFRHHMIASADVSHRPRHFYFASGTRNDTGTRSVKEGERKQLKQQTNVEVDSVAYGDQLDELSARWAAKFYGQVTFGPRNYPYPSSRWLARRFQMKKHRIIKRFRFRRYKLAAVANLPFAKMIRVGMLPELKSSKTKRGDVVDPTLSGQLVSAVKNTGEKRKGQRTRPKSKYQV